MSPADVAAYGGFAGTEDALTERMLTPAKETILSGDLVGDDISRPMVGADMTAYNNFWDDNSFNVIQITRGNIILDGLKVTAGERGSLRTLGGMDFYFGAGIYDASGAANFRITNCTIANNNVQYGGGGVAFFSSSVMMDCVFEDNGSGSEGGGGFFLSGATLMGCTINGNLCNASGGGLALLGGGTLTDCTFTNNRAALDVESTNSSFGSGGAVVLIPLWQPL